VVVIIHTSFTDKETEAERAEITCSRSNHRSSKKIPILILTLDPTIKYEAATG
jgi:hypothetical protein